LLSFGQDRNDFVEPQNRHLSLLAHEHFLKNLFRVGGVIFETPTHGNGIVENEAQARPLLMRSRIVTPAGSLLPLRASRMWATASARVLRGISERAVVDVDQFIDASELAVLQLGSNHLFVFGIFDFNHHGGACPCF